MVWLNHFRIALMYFSLAAVERQPNTCQVQKMVMQKNVDLLELVSGDLFVLLQDCSLRAKDPNLDFPV